MAAQPARTERPRADNILGRRFGAKKRRWKLKAPALPKWPKSNVGLPLQITDRLQTASVMKLRKRIRGHRYRLFRAGPRFAIIVLFSGLTRQGILGQRAGRGPLSFVREAGLQAPYREYRCSPPRNAGPTSKRSTPSSTTVQPGPISQNLLKILLRKRLQMRKFCVTFLLRVVILRPQKARGIAIRADI